MAKIPLVIGHRQGSQGAYGNEGISEYIFNRYLIADILEEIDLDRHDVRVFERRNEGSGYTERMKDLHKRIDRFGADYSISFHFNSASNQSVDGHEVLYCSKKGKALAKKLNAKFNEYLDNNDRGIKKRTKGQRGGGFLCRGKSVCILAEPFFASHQYEYIQESGVERENLISAYADFINEL